MKIENKIIGSAKLEWKKLKILQPATLKSFTAESFEALKNSLIKTNFICIFQVWADKENYWVLDGTHKIKALEMLEAEGYDIPNQFDCNLIDCKDRREAANLVLVFSTQYAKITQDGFLEFVADSKLNIDFDALDLPNIDFEKLDLGDFDFSKNQIEDDIFEYEEKNLICPQCGSKEIEKI